MTIGGRPKRRFFLYSLLFMLALSAALTFFVFRIVSQQREIMADSPVPQDAAAKSGPLSAVRHARGPEKFGNGPGWWGFVSFTRNTDSSLGVVIKPTDVRGNLVRLSSFQVFVQAPDGTEKEVTDAFKMDSDGNVAGTTSAVQDGRLRIRLHRDLMTLEFTQRIEN